MLTSHCNSYVTFLVANNTVTINLKYPHGRKSQNSFRSMNLVFLAIAKNSNCQWFFAGKQLNLKGNIILIKRLYLFMETTFPLSSSYFPSKNHREFQFFPIAREIINSDFLAISLGNGRRKLLYEVVTSFWITSNQDFVYLAAPVPKVFL